jgi:hypothetical protein
MGLEGVESMKRSKKVKFGALLALASCTVLQFGGCGMDKLGRNIWIGFGESLGSIPAGIVTELVVAPLLDSIGLGGQQ